ncbi:hypothetical protein ANCCAN_00457 [Ancylostoma caninum]|uniref:Uncharacterized protein n=1 Tax=Ancylostoma caninum TaxID=29170 RepID=A0A368H9V5_ANCCA|nr:hypothetical protein ANCCAN_00457 [Ancylostoma caninum]
MLEKEHGYMVVNRDTLGTWQKCWLFRSRYTALARELKVPCRCFELTCDIYQAGHNVKFRRLTNDASNEVGTMVLRMHGSKYEQPELSEGFDSIVHVNFVPNFEKEEHEKLYRQYLSES